MEGTIHCHFCNDIPLKKEFQQFQEILDNADKNNGHREDIHLRWNGEFEVVDKNFFVCRIHLSKIGCDECHRILTRHQLANAINSDDYNHFHDDGPKHCNFGKLLPFACTDCWIQYDNDIRQELGIEDDYEESISDTSEIPYPPLPPSPQEPKIELPKDTKKMWDHPLTLDDLNTSVNKIPKTRIQEENVRYGMAYCANETKEKSVKKLREYLEKHPNPTYLEKETQVVCTVLVDGSTSLSFPYPKGKTQKDLLNYLYDFFN